MNTNASLSVAPPAVVGAEDSAILAPSLAGRGRKILAIIVTAVLVLAVIRELAQQTRGARGPAASSYATSPAGLAALSELLRQQGTEVAQLTRPLDEAIARNEVSTDDRLVVLDQSLSPAETDALAAFVLRGGRLLGGGSRSGRWIGRIWNGDDEQVDEPADVRQGAKGTVETIGGTGITRTLTTSGTPVVWRDLTGKFFTAVVDADFRVVLAQQGSFDALADPSILSNATLAQTDNAVFALELLGNTERVVFAEAGHGFRSGGGAGFSAIPANVRTMLFGLLLAVLVWMFSIGRRIGAPDLPDRPLPPGRYEHVAAIASLLDRSDPKVRSTASDLEATTPTQPFDPKVRSTASYFEATTPTQQKEA